MLKRINSGSFHRLFPSRDKDATFDKRKKKVKDETKSPLGYEVAAIISEVVSVSLQ